MRFLLNKSCSTAALQSWRTQVSPTTKTISITNVEPTQSSITSQPQCDVYSCNDPTSSYATKKWGQQCGVSCGCVLRFELLLDDNDRVIMAEYTAKQILTTTIPLPKLTPRNVSSDISASKEVVSSIQRQRYPVLTNRTGRLQYIPTKCQALHELSTKTIQYFINRPLWQIMNHHEFQNSRSSTAFRETILSMYNLNHNPSTNSLEKSTSTPNIFHLNDSKKKKQTSHGSNYNHCYDLVEDAITALLKGYVPGPRHTEPQKLLYYNDNTVALNDSSDDKISSNDDDSIYDYNNDNEQIWSNFNTIYERKSFNDRSTTISSSSSSWQERSLHLWWPFWSWKNSIGPDDDDDANDEIIETKNNKTHNDPPKRLHRHHKLPILHSKSSTSTDRQHWTALDWTDWFESDREKQLEEQQRRLSTRSGIDGTNQQQHRNQYGKPLSSNTLDWLTYVDTLYDDNSHNNQSNNQQSA